MSDVLKELTRWDETICQVARGHKLDWFDIAYETVSYFDMLGAMAYHGLPSHYPHWSRGKAFELMHIGYNAGVEGLPYELIINSSPSIAYLMVENPLPLQVLVMAHCVGHSDFFKNNRTFAGTRPETAISRFRNARNRVQSYIEDPSIGIEAVEEVIDACRALSYQIDRRGRRRPNEKELLRSYSERVRDGDESLPDDFNLDKVPLEPEYDVFKFISEQSKTSPAWRSDLIAIIREESLYFMPQIRTKIMNEGWACFWHYRIMNEMDLPDSLHIPFIKNHNAVVRPTGSTINPYHVGFETFKHIEQKFGLDECFLARETMNDESFIRQYIDFELAEKFNFFSFSRKGKKDSSFISVDDIIDDDDGWSKVKEAFIKQIGGNSIPTIYVDDTVDNTLVLRHEHDGRDIDLNYADKCVEKIKRLWGGPVKLLTVIENESFEVS